MSDQGFRRPPLRPGQDRDAGAAAVTRARRTASGRRAPSSRPVTPRKARPSREKASARPRRRIARFVLLGLLLLTVAASVAGCSVYSSIAGNLPDPSKQLMGRDQTTKVVDRNGRLIANLFAEQNRTNVKLADIPEALRNAVVATEDERFYEHSGVDPIGIARALWVDVRRGRGSQGGSTITQQYVKNAFTTDESTLSRKVREAMLAYRVEKKYSKDQILEMYLNTIYFGHGAYGVETASEVYFGKPVGKLSVAESAMLVGIIKSPGRYSPYLDKTAAKQRRHTVLSQMGDQGYLKPAEVTAADATPVKTAGLKRASKVAPYFVEYVKALLVEQFGAESVYRSGLTVRTTLDLKMQAAAEEAARKTLDRKGDPSASVVAIDPKTGEIRAMVGGRDFTTQQYNVAVQGRRQPGSAFKPFVLAAALQQGVSPEQTFESGPVELSTPEGGEPWRVTGAGGGRSGPMRLREATERSVNSVFAQLILQVGADKVVEAAKELGIRTPVEAVPAIALGGLHEGVSPLEMASAYGTLANGGVRVAPHGIDRVSRGDKVLYEADKKEERAVSDQIAYLVTDMLKGVVSDGTGTDADIGRPVAGKTGTTQAYRDAWFVGYTPQLATSVWVGYPDAQKEMDSVHGRKVTGGSFPAEIWARFMRKALDGVEKKEFVKPDGMESKPICMETGALATDYCPKKGTGLFIKGSLPKECEVHKGPKMVVVPDVVGMSQARAADALTKAGFTVQVSEQVAPRVARGTVAAQTPTAGTKAKEKSAVTIFLPGAGGSGPGGGSGGAEPGGGNAPIGPAPGGSQDPAQGTPAAAFSWSIAGSTVTFRGEVSGGTAPYRFEWDFGDGKGGSGRTRIHTYRKRQSYTVTLTVTDAAGRTSMISRSITLN